MLGQLGFIFFYGIEGFGCFQVQLVKDRYLVFRLESLYSDEEDEFVVGVDKIQMIWIRDKYMVVEFWNFSYVFDNFRELVYIKS